jgi:hypothetical protein
MTYPEGRAPLGADDMARMNPSTRQQECEMLRARVAKLEAALNRLSDLTARDAAIVVAALGDDQ